MSCCNPLSAGGGAVAISPLSNVWFVDQAAAAGGDGSIAKPYNTLLSAVAAHAAGGTFVLTPYDYSAEVLPVLANGDWSFWGLQLGSWPEGFGSGASPSPQSLTTLPNMVIGTGGNANQVALRSVAMQNLGVQQSCSLVMQDVVVAALDCSTGPAAGTLLRADRCYFNGSGVGGAGLGDSEFNDSGFFGSQTLQCGGTNVQMTRSFGETSITFLGAAGTLNYDPWTRGRLTVPAFTNGSAQLIGIVAPRSSEGNVTSANIAAGASGNTGAHTLAGTFPYASNQTFVVQATLQFAGTTAAAYLEALCQLQASLDGGGTWNNIGFARTVSQVVNNNPTWFTVTCPAVVLVGTATADVQLRMQITNAVASGDTMTNIDVALSAIAGEL